MARGTSAAACLSDVGRCELSRTSKDRRQAYDNSGDHAGSDAKPGVGTRCSLRPEMSTVNSDGPLLPPGSRKNITTRPFGANVGPSLWKPEVRIRSPEPSGFMMPMENCPLPCLVKAM